MSTATSKRAREREYARARERKHSEAVLTAGTAMCDHLQAALLHLSHGHESLAISEICKSGGVYERLCRYYPDLVLPRELHRAFHASLDWTMRPHGLADLALATCALIEWKALAFHADMMLRKQLPHGPIPATRQHAADEQT